MTDETPPRRSTPAPPRPPHASIVEAVRLYNTQSVAIEDQYTIALGEAEAVRIAGRTYYEASLDTHGANAMQRYADAVVAAAEDLRARRRTAHAASFRAALGELWPLRTEPTS